MQQPTPVYIVAVTFADQSVIRAVATGVHLEFGMAGEWASDGPRDIVEVGRNASAIHPWRGVDVEDTVDGMRVMQWAHDWHRAGFIQYLDTDDIRAISIVDVKIFDLAEKG